MKNKTQKIVISALVAALACAATLIIHIPSPLGGYINMGDCIVLVGGWLLGPVYGFLAAGIGSALADVFLGYFVYAPATFLIKGLVALLACVLLKSLGKIKSKPLAYVISGVVAECVMVAGYYVFEGFMYGFAPSVVNIPPNVVQAVAGVVAGTILALIIEKTRISKWMK